MANSPRKPSNNIYKKGKLSKSTRFSHRHIKWTPIIVLICVIATFIFAIIFGNILGKRADGVQGSTSSISGDLGLNPPSADKVSPHDKLNAYFVDFADADPEISLSEQTSLAREQGNALFVSIKNESGKIIYSSDKVQELGFDCLDNLTLSRLKNHFEYYDDFAVGFFKSDFSANLEEGEALKLQTNEILLLKEATDTAFDQIIIEFSGKITKNNVIYYQSYLLNLKLTCSQTPIGIKLLPSFLQNSENAGCVAKLMESVDFFVLDTEDLSTDETKSTLEELIYFVQRYDCAIILSGEDDVSLEDKIALLNQKGTDSYIVK